MHPYQAKIDHANPQPFSERWKYALRFRVRVRTRLFEKIIGEYPMNAPPDERHRSLRDAYDLMLELETKG